MWSRREVLAVFTKFISTVALAGLAACQTMGTDTKPAAGNAAGAITQGSFITSDGVKLHYLEAGKGQPLVMIPGWSQSAAQFKHQLSGLSDKYRVIAIDMRGHGEIGRASCRERVCLAV